METSNSIGGLTSCGGDLKRDEMGQCIGKASSEILGMMEVCLSKPGWTFQYPKAKI